jgi:hypothetical protein
MTSIDTRQKTLTGLQIGYPDRNYSIPTLGNYLVAFNDLWVHCADVSLHRLQGLIEVELQSPVQK